MKNRNAEIKVLTHILEGISSLNRGHRHPFRTFTRRTIFVRGSHIHTFRVVTQVARGHRHVLSGTTSPVIDI